MARPAGGERLTCDYSPQFALRRVASPYINDCRDDFRLEPVRWLTERRKSLAPGVCESAGQADIVTVTLE